MTKIRSITISWIPMLFSLGGCNATETPKFIEPIEISMTDDIHVIDAHVGTVAGITVGMTEVQLRDSGWPFEMRFQNLEGDEYKIYDISLADDVILNCTLNLENTLYRIESSSVKIRDEHGLGVGTRLSELKRAYPDGKFIKGIAEGRFANFLTGTHLRFYFHPNDLDESCFDTSMDCTVDETITVDSIAIG